MSIGFWSLCVFLVAGTVAALGYVVLGLVLAIVCALLIVALLVLLLPTVPSNLIDLRRPT